MSDSDTHHPFPIKPATVPQARKYTRNFRAGEGKVFTQEDQITIEIPPIANTYLTKDARIYFKFDLSFKDHSFTAATTGLPQNWFAAPEGDRNALNILRKPVPMLDTAGPYALFRDLEIYDYLGNTLLEKVTRHDLLASILADFYLDPELERLRPPITDNQSTTINNVNPSPTSDSSKLLRNLGDPGPQTRINGINLLDPILNDYLEYGDTQASNYFEYILTPPTSTATEVKVPTWRFSMRLLSFLGHGSSNFVPLHNGYRIVLKLNPANIPIQFGLPSGHLRIMAKATPVSTTPLDVVITPVITNYSLSDVYLRAELLQVTPELDAQIDKTVRVRMNAYTILGRCDKPTIIPGNYLSVNNIKMAMRYLAYPNDPTDSNSALGFRCRTFVNKARLLYNDAVQQEYNNVNEMRNALGPEFDPLVSPLGFSVDRPNQFQFGTGGYMYPYPSQNFKWDLATIPTTLPTEYSWVYRQTVDLPNLPRNLVFSRYNDNSGKFLLLFDLALNGYHENTITGIDTTKTTLKVELERSENYELPFETDVFVEHDALVSISPGKYSSVSF